MNNFIKGYAEDAGLDIIINEVLELLPGINNIELPCTYTPAEGEVAFLVARGSTAKKGIFPISVAIDTGYEGIIHGMIVNTTDRKIVFLPGDRPFSIVNLVKAPDRQSFTIAKEGSRGSNWNNSSGGNK